MSTEENNGVKPVVHESPVVEEATDASEVVGGVTSDGAFVPEDSQDTAEVADNKADTEVPTTENTEHGITAEEETVEDKN